MPRLTWPIIVLKLTRETDFRLTISFSIITLHNSLTYERVSVCYVLSYPALKDWIESVLYSDVLFLAHYCGYARSFYHIQYD